MNISSSDWLLVFISVVAGALTTATGVYLTKQRFRVVYDVDANVLAKHIDDENIDYLYKGRTVSSVYECWIPIKSFGNQVILGDDLSTKDLLAFFITNGAVLEAQIYSGQTHSNASIEILESGRGVIVRLDRVGPKDTFLIHAFTEASPVHAKCESYVVGKPAAIRRCTPWITQFFWIMAIFAPCILMMYGAMFGWLGSGGMFSGVWSFITMASTTGTYIGIIWMGWNKFIGVNGQLQRAKKSLQSSEL